MKVSNSTIKEGGINMATKTLSISEDSLVNVLKTLPEKNLIEIFWKSLVEIDVSSLTEEEKKAVKKGKEELKKGRTIGWESLK